MSSLSVTIGADVTDLQVKLALAKSSLTSSAADVRAWSQAVQDAGDQGKEHLIPFLEQAIANHTAAAAAVKEHSASLKELTPEVEHAGSAFVTMREGVEGLNARISETKSLFSGLGELFLAGLAGDKLIETAKSAEEFGDKLHKASEETGITVENLSALAVSADHADVEFDQLQRGLGKFATGIQEGIKGSGNQAEAFKVLGISQKDLVESGNDSAAMLELVAQRLDQYGNGANKEAIVSALFGQRLRDIQPILQDLAENGLEGLREKASQVNLLFDGDFANAMKKAHENSKDFDEASHALGIELGTHLLPVVTAVETALANAFGSKAGNAEQVAQYRDRAKELAEQIEQIKAKMESENAFYQWFDGGHLAEDERQLKQIQANIQSLIPESEKLADAWKAFGLDELKVQDVKGLDEMKPDAPSMGAEANSKKDKEEAYQQAIATYQAEAAAFESSSDERIAILAKELAIAKQYWGTSAKQYQDIQKEINSAYREQSDQRLHQGQQEMATETASFISNAAEQLKAEIAHDQALVEQRKMTAADALKDENAKTNAVREADLKRLDIEIDFLQSQVALWGTGTAELQKAMGERVKISEQADAQIQKNTDQSNKEMTKSFDAAFQPIQSAFGGMIRNMISGRMTLQGALLNAGEQWLEKELTNDAEALAKKLAIYAAEELGFITGEEAKQAAQETTSSLGLIGLAEKAIKAIIGDAAQTTAGVTAFLAPILGPAALPAGAAAGASVSALAASITVASGAGGMLIDNDQLMMVHEDERLLPARYSAGLDAMVNSAADNGGAGGGGGDTYHFSVQAIDAAGVQRFFSQNAPQLMRTLAAQKRMGNTNALMK